MIRGFRIEALNAAHQRASFQCGVEALDIYLRQHVTQDIKRRLSNCLVLSNDEGLIAGYYTFAAASIPLPEIGEKDKKRLPRYAALPTALIGRLAIDQN